MNKAAKLSVLVLILMILFTSAMSYAYFSTIYNKNVSEKLNVESATYPTVIIENGGEFALSIRPEDMLEAHSSSTTPSVLATNNYPVSVGFVLSNSGGTAELNYNIYYEPTVPYYKSMDNINNEKEYVISIESDIHGLIVDEYNLNNMEESVLLSTGNISGSGANELIKENFIVTVAYYNLPYNQNDNAEKTFSGELSIIAEDIIYTP
ncbi:MAG: hypothetical protein R3Y13_04730 [bacterium]